MQVRPVAQGPIASSASSAQPSVKDGAGKSAGKSAKRADAFERTRSQQSTPKHAPEVLDLVGRYIPREAANVARPFARILTWAAKVDSIIASAAGPDAIIDALVGKDARRQVFLLEGLMRLYVDRHGQPIKEALERFTGLEDTLGDYVDARRMTKLAIDKKCPIKVVDTLREAEAEARKALFKEVEANWTPRAGDPRVPQLAAMMESLAKVDWDNPRDDRKYVQGQLVAHLRKVEGTKYDMNKLQSGIHELRRHLRWIPIYVEALDGMVVLDPKKSSPGYDALISHELASSKYVQLPPPTYEASPIVFPKALYVATAKYVLEFGDLKDRGEWVEGLADAYRHSGEKKSKKKAHKAAVKAFGATDEYVTRDAEKLYRELDRLGFLKQVRRVFANG